MDNLIAKRYAQAILTQKNADEFYELLSTLVGAFSLEKFKAILNSSQISKDEKLKFISSCLDKGKPNFMNFLKILAQNSRLNLIPQIAQELGRQKALKAQIYEGVVHSPKALHKKELDELEKKLSQKFKLTIRLRNETNAATQGIKISLDELGYELGFSMQALKSKMSEYILKTL